MHQEQIGVKLSMPHGRILRQSTLVLLMRHTMTQLTPILTEVQLEEIWTGTLASFRGLDEPTMQARDFQDKTQQAAQYASTSQKVAKHLESALKSFTVDPLSIHRPDGWKSAKKHQGSV